MPEDLHVGVCQPVLLLPHLPRLLRPRGSCVRPQPVESRSRVHKVSSTHHIQVRNNFIQSYWQALLCFLGSRLQRAVLQFLILSVLLISSLPPPLVIMSFITMSTNDVDDIVKICNNSNSSVSDDQYADWPSKGDGSKLWDLRTKECVQVMLCDIL